MHRTGEARTSGDETTRGAATDAPLAERLRYPTERLALAVAIGTDLLLVALALALLTGHAPRIGSSRYVAQHLGWFRAIAIAALLAVPTTHLGRHLQLYGARGNGIRVSEDQFPELYAELQRLSRRLGVEPVPHLYVSASLSETSAAHTVLGDRAVIVLSASIFKGDWRKDLTPISFFIARALGSLLLGHTRWWVELFTTYTRSIPALRVPLLLAWTLSRDRCAAYAVPGSVRGLVHEAAGKHLAPDVDLAAFARQAARSRGLWRYFAGVRRKEPLVTTRARALFDTGFLDRPGTNARGR
jgi:hypothetical protein